MDKPEKYYLLTVKLHLKGIEATDKKPNVTSKGRPYYLREPGELLIGRQNFHNGGIGIVPSWMKGFVASNAISSVTAIKGNIKFYYYYLSNRIKSNILCKFLWSWQRLFELQIKDIRTWFWPA